MTAENGNDEWGNVRFRPRRVGAAPSLDDAAQLRFLQGAVLFVAVALAYPWYSYWVQSHLLAADAKRAVSSLQADLRVAEAQTHAAFTDTSVIDPSLLSRPPSPRILGISEGSATSVIVADLDGASLAQSERRLCSEAARWTGRATTGRTFRVQRYRGPEPAVNVGTIRC